MDNGKHSSMNDMDSGELSSGLLNLFANSNTDAFDSMGGTEVVGMPEQDAPLTSQEQSRLEETARQFQGEEGQRSSMDHGSRSSSKRWHDTEKHKSHRAEMIDKVSVLLRRRQESPPTEKWLKQLPKKAKKLENELYRSAVSFEEYTDPRTLKYRLLVVAQNIMNDYKRKSSSHRSSSAITSSTAGAGSGDFKPRDSLQSLNEGLTSASLNAHHQDVGRGSFRVDGHGGMAAGLQPLPMDPPPPTKPVRRVSSRAISSKAIENDKEVNAKLQEQLLKAMRRNQAEMEMLKSSQSALDTKAAAVASVQRQQQEAHRERLAAAAAVQQQQLQQQQLQQQQLQQQQQQQQQNWTTANNPSLLNGMAPVGSDMGGLSTNSAVANLLQQQQQHQQLQQQALQGAGAGNGGGFPSHLLGGSSQLPDNLRMQAAMLNMQQAAANQPHLQNLAGRAGLTSSAAVLQLQQQQQQQQRRSLLRDADLLRQQQIQMLLNNSNATGLPGQQQPRLPSQGLPSRASSTGSGHHVTNNTGTGDAPLSPGTFDW